MAYFLCMGKNNKYTPIDGFQYIVKDDPVLGAVYATFNNIKPASTVNINRDHEFIAHNVKYVGDGTRELFGAASGSGSRIRVWIESTFNKKLKLGVYGYGLSEDHIVELGSIDKDLYPNGREIRVVKIDDCFYTYVDGVLVDTCPNLDLTATNTTSIRLFGSSSSYNWAGDEPGYAADAGFRFID